MPLAEPATESTDAFVNALHMGSGRALLYLREHGGSAVIDAVLQACLHDTAYDRQCERSRAPWLLQVVEAANAVPQACAALEQVLPAAAADNTGEYDYSQQVELAALLLARGAPIDGDLVQACLAAWWQEHSTCPDGSAAWIEWAGTSALQLIACSCSERLRQNDSWVPPLDQLYDDTIALARAWASLREIARTDARVRPWLNYCNDLQRDKHEAERPTRQRRRRARYHHLMQRAATRIFFNPELTLPPGPAGRGVRGTLRRHSRHLRAWQCQRLFDRLRVQHDERQGAALLFSFHHTPLPALPAHILPWACSSDPEVQDATCEALGLLAHPEIRDLALHWLQSDSGGEALARATRLLWANYAPGDETLLLQRLQQQGVIRTSFIPLPAIFSVWYTGKQ